jgi:hypothetical protein
MPSNETVLLDGYIAEAQAARQVPLPDDVAFEVFSAQMVLRDRNLSDDEIELGRVGGGQDGGIDGIYVFLDGELLDDDSDIFADGFATASVRKHAELTLWMTQAKRETSFAETTFDKAASSLSRLLDLTQTDADLDVYYSADTIARMRLFTRAWTVLSVRSPVLIANFDYVTRGDSSSNVHPAVDAKRIDLEALLSTKIPGSTTRSRLVGARELWEAANSIPEYNLQLRFSEYLTKGQSFAGLVNLAEYFEFLCDPDGTLREHLFDWNVRDFQGAVTVNRDIQTTLDSADAEDFWWLNNGVTILCSDVSISGDRIFTMENVQIVNGMQTSHSIHAAISRVGAVAERDRDRSVLVRVFKTQDADTRDRIIRATNSQTKVPDASLHATEDIHRQLETYFQSKGWYYDRRKNYYKNNGKPADRIVSIPGLGQSVMAVGLGRPDDARARPTTILNNAADYGAIFSRKIPLQTYLWIAQVQRRIDDLMLDPGSYVGAHQRTNFRFHAATYLVFKHLSIRVYNPQQLNASAQLPIDFFNVQDVRNAVNLLNEEAQAIAARADWSLDRVAKSQEFAETVISLALGERQATLFHEPPTSE